MYEKEIRQADLLPYLGKGATYLSRRMNAKEPFDISDMKVIGGILEIPKHEWLEFFME